MCYGFFFSFQRARVSIIFRRSVCAVITLISVCDVAQRYRQDEKKAKTIATTGSINKILLLLCTGPLIIVRNKYTVHNVIV